MLFSHAENVVNKSNSVVAGQRPGGDRAAGGQRAGSGRAAAGQRTGESRRIRFNGANQLQMLNIC